MSSRPTRDAFWRTVPTRGKVLFFGAVFCIFAPGMILPTRLADPAPSAVAAAFAASGLIGMFWAMAAVRNWWFVTCALAMQGLTAVGFSGALPAWLWPRASGFNAVGFACFMLAVAGYAAFVTFIATEGRRSLRERAELALAQQIHASLVPPIDLTARGYAVLGRSMPSTEVGGDLIDLAQRDGGLDIYLGDVTGHGVRSGVVMAMTKAAIHTAQRAGADLPALLAEVNDVLAELTETGIFVTFAALRCEPGGKVTYALAGHLPILWWRHADNSITRLDNEALPLGIVEGQPFAAREILAHPGDLLVVLTDGFIEVAGRDGRQLGIDGFERLLTPSAHHPLPQLFDHLVARVREVGEIHDDQTLLLIRVS